MVATLRFSTVFKKLIQLLGFHGYDEVEWLEKVVYITLEKLQRFERYLTFFIINRLRVLRLSSCLQNPPDLSFYIWFV